MVRKKKERVFIIIDGSNFYHRLKEPPHKLKNLLEFDFTGFVKFLLGNRKLIGVCYYVGAIRTEKGNRKSYKLFRNQRRLFAHLGKQNIGLFRGFILKADGYHEKGVDVQIAVDILVGAYENLWDTAIILSSDTDLLPAISKARQLGKNIEYVGFSHKPSLAMISQSTTPRLLMIDEVTPFLKKIK